MGMLCTINRAVGTATDAVEKAHDSVGGKWTMMGMVGAALITGIVNFYVAWCHHQEAMLRFHKQEHVLNVMHGSNLVADVESEVNAKNQGTKQ